MLNVSASKCLEGNTGTSKQKSPTPFVNIKDDGKKSKNYTWTSYEVKAIPLCDIIKYVCYSPELCPSSGRKHWQGFIHLKNQMTISALQKYFRKHNWSFGKLFKSLGTIQENRIYCGFDKYEKIQPNGTIKTKEKNNDFFEWGTPPSQGCRTDLNKIKDNLVDGTTTLKRVVLDDPLIYHQYGRTLEKINNYVINNKFRSWMTKGTWYYGKTGTGKSHKAFQNYNNDTHYVLNQHDNGFWQGYNGQEIVIINEFRGEINFSEILDIVDKYPKKVKIKGNDPVPLLAKQVIITSCFHPMDIYKNSLSKEEHFDQFERRFDIIHLTEQYNPHQDVNIIDLPNDKSLFSAIINGS